MEQIIHRENIKKNIVLCIDGYLALLLGSCHHVFHSLKNLFTIREVLVAQITTSAIKHGGFMQWTATRMGTILQIKGKRERERGRGRLKMTRLDAILAISE